MGIELVPRASSMIEALRSFGYTPESAIADIIDNSIAANAKKVDIQMYDAGDNFSNSYVSICDDGKGLNEKELVEKAMYWGTKDHIREHTDLGKFGFGLKSASLSQCKKLTVISKGSHGRVNLQQWDVDHIRKTDKWEITSEITSDLEPHIKKIDEQETGTLVLWQNLDKLLEAESYSKKWRHRILSGLRIRTKKHISMIFNRFMKEINFTTQGTFPIEPWDPFYEADLHTEPTPMETIDYKGSQVSIMSFILREQKTFEDEEYHGPSGDWNDRQGIYIFRKNRLIVPGGWHNVTLNNRLITKREKYNRLRIMINYDGENDNDWRLDVRKNSVIIPGAVKHKLSQIVEKQFDLLQKKNFRSTPVVQSGVITPWLIRNNYGRLSAKIDRENDLVKRIINSPNLDKAEFEKLLKILERTLPLENIDFKSHVSSLNDEDTDEKNKKD